MEALPKIIKITRLPITITIREYLRDHIFKENAILPAVESMQLLAESTASLFTDIHKNAIHDARFNKFIPVDPNEACIHAFNDVVEYDNGDVKSCLITIKKSSSTSITRPIEHVSCLFKKKEEELIYPPLDSTLGLEGICLKVIKERLYQELVPFKAAYHNIDDLYVSRKGALAYLNGGYADAPTEPLGSPFPLDASFHAANVWGQRFAGIVGFPVRIDKRLIIKKTERGRPYISRVIPVQATSEVLVFNIWIVDADGNLCEEILGLHMQDVSGKTILPPVWIAHGKNDSLESLNKVCKDVSIIELQTVSTACDKILSPAEKERFLSMREKRGRSYLAARLCLKALSRRLSGNDMKTLPHEITTIIPDGRPACPLTNGTEPIFCSASHDDRFAVAVASVEKIGVDVEKLSDRVLKSQRLYMHEDEITLVKSHPLGEVEASLRVWSIKEAVSKALNIYLPGIWEKTVVIAIEKEKSLIRVDGMPQEALHAQIDEHVFTVVKIG